jgi:hypothetical protein
MAGGFPFGREIINAQNCGQLAGSNCLGVNVISASSANVKSSFVTIIASTGFDFDEILIEIGWQPTGYSAALVDIAIGAAGAEYIIIPNLLINVQNGGQAIGITLPMKIPAGSRISARTQCTTASSNIYINVIGFDSAFTNMEGVAGYDMLGASLATSIGTAVTPNSNGTTKGSFSQITAATPREYIGFTYQVDNQNTSNIGNNSYYAFDIAFGASGSELIVLPNVSLVVPQGGFQPCYQFISMPIPTGTRISARAQGQFGSSPVIGVTVYGAFL